MGKMDIYVPVNVEKIGQSSSDGITRDVDQFYRPVEISDAVRYYWQPVIIWRFLVCDLVVCRVWHETLVMSDSLLESVGEKVSLPGSREIGMNF